MTNSLVLVDSSKSKVHPLISGASFYASPKFSPDGKYLAWLQWNHPDMPWDGAELHVADVVYSPNESSLQIKNDRKVKGNWKTESTNQPEWIKSDTLVFFCDETGYQNPWIVNVSTNTLSPRLLLSKALDEEFSQPMWRLGPSSYATLSPTKALTTSLRDGRAILYLLDITNGDLKEINSPYVTIQALRATGPNSAVFLGSKTDSPSSIVSLTLSDSHSASFTEIIGGEASLTDEEKVDKAYYSSPRALTFRSLDGGPLYVVFYAPTNANYSAPAGERPPCIVCAHGGPTGMTTQELKMKTQFFTSRGFAWVDVNYAGSAGYGRKYV